MLLSDIIAQLQDPAFASEAMLALDDITLTARVAAAAGADRKSTRLNSSH